MELARDRAGPAVTRKVTLVQEGESAQPGILIFFPVYAEGRDPGTEALRRGALLGWVYSPLQVKGFLERVLGQDLQIVRLEVFDGAGTGPDQLLYDSRPGARTPPALSTTLNLPVNQVSWTLRFTADAPYLAAIRQRSPAVEFGFMTLIALLLTGLSVAAVASWRARQLAVDLSGSLRESEARWRTTFERAPVGIFTVDAEDHFLQVNRRYCGDHRLHDGRAPAHAPVGHRAPRRPGRRRRGDAPGAGPRDRGGVAGAQGAPQGRHHLLGGGHLLPRASRTGGHRGHDRGPRRRHRPARRGGQVPRDRGALPGRDPHRCRTDGSPTPTPSPPR